MLEEQVLVLRGESHLGNWQPSWPSRCCWAKGSGCVLWLCTFLTVSTETSWNNWPSSTSRWTPPRGPHHFPAPAAPPGDLWEACCCTRPSEARPPWTASSCLMGSHRPVWMVVPTALKVVCLKPSWKEVCLPRVSGSLRFLGSTRQSQALWRRRGRRNQELLPEGKAAHEAAEAGGKEHGEDDWHTHRGPSSGLLDFQSEPVKWT